MCDRTRIIAAVSMLTLSILITAEAANAQSADSASERQKQKPDDPRAEVQELASKIVQLKTEYEALSQRYGKSHPVIQQNQAQLAQLTAMIRDQKTNLEMLSEDDVYAEIEDKALALSRAIAKLSPAKVQEKGFQQAMNILDRTLNEVKTKSAAAETYRQDAEQAMMEAKQRYSMLAQKLAESEDMIAQAEANKALALYQQIAEKREAEMQAMQAELANLEAARVAQQQRKTEAAAKAAMAVADKKLSDAQQAADGSVNARLSRVEDELAQIKALLQKLMERDK